MKFQKERENAEDAKAETERKRKARRDEIYLMIIKYTQWTVPALIFSAVAVATYGLGNLGYWIYGTGVFQAVWAAGVGLWAVWQAWEIDWYYLGRGVLIAVVGVFVVFLIAITGEGVSRLLRECTFIPTVVRKTGKAVGKPFVKTAGVVCDVTSFFKMFFKTFKENHCPGIVWEKENN